MWSPLNIATVDLDVPAGQDEGDQASPVSHQLLCTQLEESDDNANDECVLVCQDESPASPVSRVCTPRKENGQNDDSVPAREEKDDQASSSSQASRRRKVIGGNDDSVSASQEEDDQASAPVSQHLCTPRKEFDDSSNEYYLPASHTEDDRASPASPQLVTPRKGIDGSNDGIPASQEDDHTSPTSPQLCTPRKEVDDNDNKCCLSDSQEEMPRVARVASVHTT